MNLTILTNGTHEEEKALYDNDKKEIIIHGDYYHDKIDERIEGIITGIKYCNIEVNVSKLIIYPLDKLFKKYHFYNNKDE